MKKVIFTLVLLLSLLLPNIAGAMSYEVSNYNMTIDIKTNGDAEVTEKITYDFNGDFNGVYRDIDFELTDGIENLKIYVDDGNSLREFSQGQNGGINIYELSEDNDILNLKIYEKTNSSKKTFIYTFTLKNVAERYSDVAILNRRLIDTNWEVPLHNVLINIRIPQGATKNELKVFAHGPLEGFSEIVDERNFSFFVERVMPGTFVETLVVFPQKLIPTSGRISKENILPTILEREQRLADEANKVREEARARIAQEEHLQKIRVKLFPVFIGIILGGLASIISLNRKYARESKPIFDGDYYRELPGDYTPAVMSFLLTKGNVGSNDIMATILDLVRKKVLRITEFTVPKKGLFSKAKESYLIEKIKATDPKDLSRHEIFLVEWFLDKLGNDDGLILDDLKDKVKKKKYALEFQKDYEVFKELARMEGSKIDFFTSNDLKGSKSFIFVALFLIGTGLTSLFYLEAWIFGPISILIAVGILLNMLFLRFMKKRSPYGIEQAAMWKAFKKFLLHFSSMDKATIPSIIIWEHYLVYAISLGVAKEVLAQLPKVFSEAELRDPSLTYMGGHNTFYSFHLMNSMLTNTTSTIDGIVNTASIATSRNSSGSGGGGGFSGGSSGGGGGRGGGGAF